MQFSVLYRMISQGTQFLYKHYNYFYKSHQILCQNGSGYELMKQFIADIEYLYYLILFEIWICNIFMIKQDSKKKITR